MLSLISGFNKAFVVDSTPSGLSWLVELRSSRAWPDRLVAEVTDAGVSGRNAQETMTPDAFATRTFRPRDQAEV
jgi:hypothetical protein